MTLTPVGPIREEAPHHGAGAGTASHHHHSKKHHHGRRNNPLAGIHIGAVLPLVCSTEYLPIVNSCPGTIGDADFEALAKQLDCEMAALQAVAHVESHGAGFQSDGRPTILFEAHVFGKLTGYQFNKDYPTVSVYVEPKDKSLYHGDQYLRLELAYPLNPEAALKSASWGKFQVLGRDQLGYDDVFKFVNAMYQSETEHLKAFTNYIVGNKLTEFLRKKNWAAFAKAYNGRHYAENNYDTAMERAYAKFTRPSKHHGAAKPAKAS